MAIADGAGSVDPDRVALEQELAELAFELGRHDDALRLWCELAWRSRDAATVAHASLRASQAALELGRRSDAWLHLERARTKSGGDAVLVIEMLAHEAALQRYLERRPDEARITSRRALDLARALVARAGGIEHLDDPARRACLRATLAAADGARMGDDAYEMLALAEEVTETSAGLDDRVEISALVQGAMALRFLGRNTEAEMRLRQAWDAARRRVLPQAVLEAGAALGRVLLSMGRLEETEAIVRECTALGFRLTEFRPGRTFMVTLPWLLGLSRGDWRQAADGLRVAAETEPEPHYRLHAHLERAAALARLDPNHASDEIRVAVAAALTDAETATCRRCLAEASVRCGEALARIGDVAAGDALASGVHIPATDAHNRYWRSRAEAAVAAASATDRSDRHGAPSRYCRGRATGTSFGGGVGPARPRRRPWRSRQERGSFGAP